MLHPGSALRLWILLGLFCLRVFGQLAVAVWQVPWLPEMEKWSSGLLPYPVLLASQFALIGLMASWAAQVTLDRGFFAGRRPRLGRILVNASWIYAGAMALRYAVWMWLRPDQRWFGHTIPIFFHFVLASFLFTGGSHLARPGPRTSPDSAGTTRSGTVPRDRVSS